MPALDPVRVAAGQYGYLCRTDINTTPEDRAAALRNLKAAQLERHVQEAIQDAPPLTMEQRERIARLLVNGTEGR